MTAHGISVTEANEALADPDRVEFRPDYNSESGVSIRTIGYSPTKEALVSVITVDEGGITYGVNGWPSNDKDQRYYRQEDGS